MRSCYFCKKSVFTGSKPCGTMVLNDEVYHYHIDCVVREYPYMDEPIDLFLDRYADEIFAEEF